MKKIKIESYVEEEKRKFNKWIENILTDKKFTPKQRKTLRKYHNFNVLQSDSAPSHNLYLVEIKKFLLGVNKEVEDITRADIDKFLLTIKDMKLSSRLNLTASIIRFFKWLKRAELIKDIKIMTPKYTKLPEDILSKEEVLELARISTNNRDRAIILVLYESACRRSEFLGLRRRDIVFDENGCTIQVSGKTGSRKLRLIHSAGALRDWYNAHPYKKDRDNPIWIALGSHRVKKCITGVSLNRILKTLGARAKLSKVLYPHLIRHTRLTHLAQILSESELRLYAGWTADSRMVRTYVHLNMQNVEDKLLRNAGLIKAEEQVLDVLKPKICSRCSKKNLSSVSWCSYCNYPLDFQAVQQLEERDKNLMKLAEVISNKEAIEEIKAIVRRYRTKS